MPKVDEQHRTARRAQILDAARRCFIRQGFHETSMHDLLSEAGLSSGALYSYFSSKTDVIVAIAEENMSQVRALLQSLAADQVRRTRSGALADILELLRAQHAENGFATIALLVWSEAARNPALATRLTALLKEYRDSFEELADDAGLTPSGSVGALFTSIIAGFLLHLAMGDAEAVKNLPETVDAIWPDTDDPGRSRIRRR